MNELEAIESEALIRELQSRYDASIIVFYYRTNKTNIDGFYSYYSGGIPTCLGLCNLVKNELLEDFNKQ